MRMSPTVLEMVVWIGSDAVGWGWARLWVENDPRNVCPDVVDGSIRHAFEQPSPLVRPPSSHCSPSAESTVPFPHFCVQMEPRRHCPLGSPPIFVHAPLHAAPFRAKQRLTHFPAGSTVQSAAQPSPSATPSSSHCSPVSTMPLPQRSRHTEPSAHTPSGGPATLVQLALH